MMRAFLVQQFCFFLAAALLTIQIHAAENNAPHPALVHSEFIFEQAPFRSCHASTIVETHDGLVAAWFGGSREGALDVSIWIARHDGQGWSGPAELVNGANGETRVRYPCWNPVLFKPKNGPLFLFYKVGPNPQSWWGMVTTSDNNGKTWSWPKRLPPDVYGPIKNKPVELDENLIVSGSSTENAGWRVHMESTLSFGKTWSRTPALNSAMEFGAIQPAVLAHPSGKLQILCRTKQRKITEAWSDDRGQTWSRMMATQLPNPNSGIDAVMLRDGRAWLVYNHTTTGRGVLNVAISPDGKRWFAGLVLENEPGKEFSYPAIIQTADSKVHVTYTWHRQRIKHVVLDPFKLSAGQEIVEGQWP